MSDGLFGCGHHTVVCCNDDDGNIRNLSSSSTHGSKGFVTRCIEKRNLSAVFQLHVIGSDVLRNAARLSGNDVGIADIIEQRGLSMVNMSHHSNDR